jgi:p-cumate 2,3-dioxygenase alpha subunit
MSEQESSVDALNIKSLVVDDPVQGVFRTNRQAFTDEEILKLEKREIFDKCWLYAGHESEIKKPGDFVTRNVGGRPLLLVRAMDGTPQVFLNTCTHRGNIIAREKSGNARAFTCFYHAWSFDTQGALIGVPGEDAYTNAFKRDEMGLKPVPRFECYRGLMFVCYDVNAVDLDTYLGEEARLRIDYFLDNGGQDVEISPGGQSYSMKANWKLLVENSLDGYHLLSTHQRYFRKYLPDIGLDASKWLAKREPGTSRARSLGNGHTVIETLDRGTPLSAMAGEELAQIRADLVSRFGEEYAHKTADYQRNLFIFPNLIMISMWKTVRTFYPVSPDYMEVDAWGLFPTSDSPDLRQKRIENFLSFLGPAGLATPDDVSGLEGCQRGFAAATEVQWSDISRGMGSEQPTAGDELQIRGFWRKWHALLQGNKGEVSCDDQPQKVLAAGESKE